MIGKERRVHEILRCLASLVATVALSACAASGSTSSGDCRLTRESFEMLDNKIGGRIGTAPQSDQAVVIALLRTLDRKRSESTCVATLVDAGLALTAHHCVLDEWSRPLSSLVLEFRDSSSGSVERVSAVPLWQHASAALDYVLLELANPRPESSQPLILASRMPYANERLVLVEFDNESGVTESRQYCLPVLLPNYRSSKYLAHSCETHNGSSGSPLISTLDGTVIGFHLNDGKIARFGAYAQDIRAVERFLDFGPINIADNATLGTKNLAVEPDHFFTVVALSKNGRLADRYVAQARAGLDGIKCASEVPRIRKRWKELEGFRPRPPTP